MNVSCALWHCYPSPFITLTTTAFIYIEHWIKYCINSSICLGSVWLVMVGTAALHTFQWQYSYRQRCQRGLRGIIVKWFIWSLLFIKKESCTVFNYCCNILEVENCMRFLINKAQCSVIINSYRVFLKGYPMFRYRVINNKCNMFDYT